MNADQIVLPSSAPAMPGILRKNPMPRKNLHKQVSSLTILILILIRVQCWIARKCSLIKASTRAHRLPWKTQSSTLRLTTLQRPKRLEIRLLCSLSPSREESLRQSGTTRAAALVAWWTWWKQTSIKVSRLAIRQIRQCSLVRWRKIVRMLNFERCWKYKTSHLS